MVQDSRTVELNSQEEAVQSEKPETDW